MSFDTLAGCKVEYSAPRSRCFDFTVSSILCQSDVPQRGSRMPGSQGIWIDEEDEDF